MRAAGADGCRRGWICVAREVGGGEIESHCVESAAELFALVPAPALLAVDIPIGLSDRGPRECDRQARQWLGRPRGSSVFPAPIRPVLRAGSWERACALRQRAEGKRMSKQAWGIVEKVRDVDRELCARPALRRRVREVHPEVSFRAWAGRPMRHRKTRRPGRQERLEIVRRHFGAIAFAAVRERYPVKDVGHDDILDAFAALWSAERALRGAARTLPPEPPRDARGLPMEIVY